MKTRAALRQNNHGRRIADASRRARGRISKPFGGSGFQQWRCRATGGAIITVGEGLVCIFGGLMTTPVKVSGTCQAIGGSAANPQWVACAIPDAAPSNAAIYATTLSNTDLLKGNMLFVPLAEAYYDEENEVAVIVQQWKSDTIELLAD